MPKRILIVDDERAITSALSSLFMQAGYEPLTAHTGPDALTALDSQPDLIVLDLMLPGLDGYEVCRHARRAEPYIPIIMLTARDESSDKVLGLELGADVYLTKPFEPRELLAQVRAMFRAFEQKREGSDERPLSAGPLKLWQAQHRVELSGHDIELTATEFALLLAFMGRPGRVLGRETLLREVWGHDYLGDSRMVDVHINRLRAKLEPDPSTPELIDTVRGVGYRLNIPNRMIAVSFKLVLLIGLILIIGLIVLAIVLDRRLTRRSEWQVATLRPAFDSAPFGVLALDPNRIQYANPAVRRLLGLDVGPLPASSPWRDALLADLLSAFQSASGSSYRLFSPSDDQHLSWTVFPLSDKRTGLAFILDLSQQRKLESASRLFINTLSHELRTPLTAVLAHVEVLRRADSAPAVRDVSLNLIHQESNRLARLVQDLLMLNRLDTLPDLGERPLNLLLLVEDVVSEIFPLAEARQLNISIESDSPISLVRGNADYLKQAILNLLDNALKYCRPGDEIKVVVKNETTGVLCQISDSGPGIAPEHLPHITRRFYRADQSVEGTGLGLALVDEILRRHHSKLMVESHHAGPQTGTSFRFVLPGGLIHEGH